MRQIQGWLAGWLWGAMLASVAQAQIAPDQTLGAERSRLTPSVMINGGMSDRIDGGAIRGTNLFHSFSEFNINTGQRVYFANPATVQNILTRVTGTSATNIQGVLGVDGAANLFLLNPNGIFFGQNARLDLRGSFVGTTANAIRFADQGVFGASDRQAPPLLTINPSALLFTQINPRAIVNQGFLTVPLNQNLGLVGGTIRIEEGVLFAPGGKIEIGAVAGAGAVGLDSGSLFMPNNLARANVSLTGSGMSVVARGGGSIAVYADDLSVSDSVIQAGIQPGAGTIASQAGDITLNTTGALRINEGLIANWVFPGSVGNGGNIRIITDSLSAKGSDYISASTWGQGNAGSVFVQATNDIALDGMTIFSTVNDNAKGNAGDINVTARNLSITQGGGLNATTLAQGNGGNITLNIRDRITIDGVNSDLRSSSIVSGVDDNAKGQGGNIRINTGSLFLSNSAKIDTSVTGEGNGGNIRIVARDTVSLDGVTRGSDYASAIFSTIEETGRGSAGNIQIQTGSLFLTNGGVLQSLTKNEGNAGNIFIQARDSVVVDGASIQNVIDRGAEGKVFYVLSSGILSSVLENAKGNAGSIEIDAGKNIALNPTANVSSNAVAGEGKIDTTKFSVSVEIASSTNGRGNAGRITLKAGDRISLNNDAVVATLVDDKGIGQGGEIRVTSGSLFVANASQLDATTFGQGNAGNVIVDARDAVEFTGAKGNFSSGILSTSERNAKGNAGNIQINAGLLIVSDRASLDTVTTTTGNAGIISIQARDQAVFRNGGRLSSSTNGAGNAGNISIAAGNQVVFDQNAKVFSVVGSDASGAGGNIQIVTGDLTVSNASGLFAETSGVGNAGNVIVNARDSVLFSGLEFDNNEDTLFTSISNRVRETAEGNAGDIRIDANSLTLKNRVSLDATTEGKGNAGSIFLNIRDRISLDQAIISNIVGSARQPGRLGQGQGGTIRIDTGSLFLTTGAQLQASTFGRGDAGNIIINARNTVSLAGTKQPQGYRSAIFSIVAPNSTGKGGNIEVRTDALSVSDLASVNVSTAGNGDAGNIDIVAQNNVFLSGRSLISADTEEAAVGRGGSIRIAANQLIANDRAQISVDSQGSGIAGDIIVNANQLRLSDRAQIVAEAASQDGGNIRIENADLLLLRRNGLISATAVEGGNGGNISIDANTIVAPLQDNSDISANAFRGNGGNVRIKTQGIFGTQARSQPTSESDITASSQLGVQGTITIAQPNIQPVQGTIELPTTPIPGNQIAQTCPRGNPDRPLGSFVVSGRGSAPSSPIQPLSGRASIPLASVERTASTAIVPQERSPQIVEAQEWIKRDGKVMLVARSGQTGSSAGLCPQ